MLERLSIRLTTQERLALQKAADAEMRDMRDQIRFILCLELTRRGLLLPSENLSEPEKALPSLLEKPDRDSL